MVAAHSSHPLALQKQGVYLTDIVDENLFLYPSHAKPNFSTQVRGLFSEYSLDPKNIKEVREIQLDRRKKLERMKIMTNNGIIIFFLLIISCSICTLFFNLYIVFWC